MSRELLASTTQKKRMASSKTQSITFVRRTGDDSFTLFGISPNDVNSFRKVFTEHSTSLVHIRDVFKYIGKVEGVWLCLEEAIETVPTQKDEGDASLAANLIGCLVEECTRRRNEEFPFSEDVYTLTRVLLRMVSRETIVKILTSLLHGVYTTPFAKMIRIVHKHYTKTFKTLVHPIPVGDDSPAVTVDVCDRGCDILLEIIRNGNVLPEDKYDLFHFFITSAGGGYSFRNNDLYVEELFQTSKRHDNISFEMAMEVLSEQHSEFVIERFGQYLIGPDVYDSHPSSTTSNARLGQVDDVFRAVLSLYPEAMNTLHFLSGGDAGEGERPITLLELCVRRGRDKQARFLYSLGAKLYADLPREMYTRKAPADDSGEGDDE